MWTVFESVGKLLAHGEPGLGTFKLHGRQCFVVQSLCGGLFVFLHICLDFWKAHI